MKESEDYYNEEIPIKRIPIWRNIKSITDIAENNHYYKLGDNMLSMIPVKDIAHWIKE